MNNFLYKLWNIFLIVLLVKCTSSSGLLSFCGSIFAWLFLDIGTSFPRLAAKLEPLARRCLRVFQGSA
jgi:hypothetical protein